jgi:hypothetical protein
LPELNFGQSAGGADDADGCAPLVSDEAELPAVLMRIATSWSSTSRIRFKRGPQFLLRATMVLGDRLKRETRRGRPRDDIPDPVQDHRPGGVGLRAH